MDFIEKATELANACDVLTLTSIDLEGYPRAISMMKVDHQGIKTFWFGCQTPSEKVKHYQKNPKAGVTFWQDHGNVALTGTIEIIEDLKIKDKKWRDWMKMYYTNSSDPNYTLLKFTSHHGTLTFDGVLKRIQLD